jgi:hypothetical protein
MTSGPDPVLSGFMRKYGAQRATDKGPLCPHCGKVVTRDTAAEWYGDPGFRGPVAHSTCDVRAANQRSGVVSIPRGFADSGVDDDEDGVQR